MASRSIASVDVKLLVALFNSGRYHDMENEACRLIARYPNFGFAWKALGTALRMQGKDAIHALRKATMLLPDDAEAFNNLGNAFLDNSQFDAAETNYRRAIDIKPDFAEAYCNLGNILREKGHLDQAMLSCRKALESRPDFFKAHHNLGNVLQDLGQIDDAIAHYRRALELKPDLAETYNSLGNALQNLGKLSDASAHYRRALELNPAYADAYNNLGVVERKFGFTGDAESNCQKALAMKPNLTQALVFMSELQADKGYFTDAENSLRRAISYRPDSPEAWAGLAYVRKMTGNDADWLSAAQKVVEHALPPRREALIRYAMGKYHDDIGLFDEAFLHYHRANELTKRYGIRYDQQRQAQLADQLCGLYDREWQQLNRQQTGEAYASERPVFIVGMPRSGTSLVEQILAAHPSICGAGELPFWGIASGAFAPFESNRDAAIGTSLHASAQEYLQLLEGFSIDALRVIDKMPGNFLFLGLIHAAFPHARIIHMQRNPIDTCLSIYFQRFETVHAYANDLGNLTHYYQTYSRIMKHWHATLPSHALLAVSYEALINEPEHWSRKIVDFIGLQWNERCLNFQGNARSVRTASNWQVRQKINQSSVLRWRHYEKFIGPLLTLLSV